VTERVDDGASYAAAGVDIEAGDRAVELMKAWVAKASRPEVVGGIGGFAGLFDASALTSYRRPLLATSTDGVGTKVAIAAAADRHDTIGHDLVGMVVDDLVVCGAEPLFMTDYIACGKVVPERIASIVKGIAEGCVLAGCALVGGETAEHPGLLGADEDDVAGAEALAGQLAERDLAVPGLVGRAAVADMGVVRPHHAACGRAVVVDQPAEGRVHVPVADVPRPRAALHHRPVVVLGPGHHLGVLRHRQLLAAQADQHPDHLVR
jgi:hydrogenase maturation factor